METIYNPNIINKTSGVIGGVLGWYFGKLDGFLIALITFIMVDYITGFLRALVEKRLNSRVGARGIAKKITILLIVGLATMINNQIIQGDSSVLRTAVIFFYISNEGLSIIENSAALGLPIPDKFKEALVQLNDKKKEDI